MDAQSRGIHQRNVLPMQYPQNTKPLENQVAGHSFDDGHCTIGMLKDEEGFVLKPVNKPEQGRREILFYETLMISSEEKTKELNKFVPHYFGTLTLLINGKSTQFLKLEDVTRGFKKPCVMDVKIGKQTWEPGASIVKQQREEAKYATCKQQFGFCIPGFQVYNPLNGRMQKFGKDYGKKMTTENIPEVLKTFLNVDCGCARAVGEEMLCQLKVILSWCRTQCIYHMYSSSILLTYDADSAIKDPCVRVRLIDFAHVLPANKTIDLNYLNGLESFVQILACTINNL